MKTIIATILLSIAGAAYATCTTTTIYGPNGQMTICQTCCVGNTCTTHCR